MRGAPTEVPVFALYKEARIRPESGLLNKALGGVDLGGFDLDTRVFFESAVDRLIERKGFLRVTCDCQSGQETAKGREFEPTHLSSW